VAVAAQERQARIGTKPVAPPRGRDRRLEAPESGASDPVGETVGVERLCAHWRAALDSAQNALRAANGDVPARELATRRQLLAAERESTLRLLKSLARARGESGRFLHLTPRGWERQLLGLPRSVAACVFNVDGVLVGSASLHLAAWMQTFDEFIWARTERTGGRFSPFNPRTDYWDHVHGKPRLEGVRAFLASRGISLAEGDPYDPPGTETVHGLANRKNELLVRRIEQLGVSADEGSLRYLETAREAGVHRAVVSASANTDKILERAGLAGLIESCVDGNMMVAEHLQAKPAPDTLLAACRQLRIEPLHAAAFESSSAGVAAAREAGFALVVRVDQTGRALRSGDADRVVAGLGEFLERRLAA
jgi:HAD superfamily hydrolase (TIGR01509 family)